jgi:predicted enzyme related to lactoylglutathione lyase
MVYDIGGGIPDGKPLKAIQIGGPTGGYLPASSLDLPIDYEHLSAAETTMGSGSILVIDGDACIVDQAKYSLSFIQSESCGKCVFCREGTMQMAEILTDMTEGRVLGIGGLFFRARDPDALTGWYKEMLGVGGGCSGTDEPGTEWTWNAAGGHTVFAPFKQDSDYFAADKTFMINLRVSGLDALVSRLEAAGIAAERRAEWDHPDVGRFARIHDPEGNAIELWEPAGG